MNFVELETVKNEIVSVNSDKVLFFADTKKGTTVVFDDGTTVELALKYEEVCERFQSPKIKKE